MTGKEGKERRERIKKNRDEAGKVEDNPFILDITNADSPAKVQRQMIDFALTSSASDVIREPSTRGLSVAPGLRQRVLGRAVARFPYMNLVHELRNAKTRGWQEAVRVSVKRQLWRWSWRFTGRLRWWWW